MNILWRWFVAFLVWLSADPVEVDLEHPRAAAAVSAARASMETDAAPVPPAPPGPTPGKCCGECNGKGVIIHGDGHRTPCPCPASCPCKAKACQGGTCPR